MFSCFIINFVLKQGENCFMVLTSSFHSQSGTTRLRLYLCM